MRFYLRDSRTGALVCMTNSYGTYEWLTGPDKGRTAYFSPNLAEALLKMLPTLRVGEFHTSKSTGEYQIITIDDVQHILDVWHPVSGNRYTFTMDDFFSYFYPMGPSAAPPPDKTSADIKKCKRFVPSELPKHYMYSDEEQKFQMKRQLTRTLRTWPKCAADGMSDLEIETWFEHMPDRTTKMMGRFACRKCGV